VRALAQRVRRASVSVAGEVVAAIDSGLLVLVGVAPHDDLAAAHRLADKLAALRLFPDDRGRMDLAVGQAGGAVLVVSQFTLYGDVTRGNRPSFTGAAGAEHARPLVAVVAAQLRSRGLVVAEGEFGAHMIVASENDGPVTIWLDDAPRLSA
jgi:D-aminoacyl-tRNA deacylase